VFGIFNAFSVIAVSGLSDAGAFATGIKLALITTVIGLVVAIPHVIAFNYLNASMESEQDNVENDVLLQLGRILKEKDHIRSQSADSANEDA
ncbi:MAG: MotA/TolQ/ExbB proton channel family protein, partial [Fibrobacter sp.]|nr:MotA/TolQ/ExbB proton channel family protein [Fibrobacter sp.]